MHPFDVIKTSLIPGTCALIEANAGTGKTFNIQHLYLRLLLEQGLEPSQILVVTFTEAATAELRDRIRQNISAALSCLSHGNTTDQLLQNLIAQARGQGKTDDDLRAALRLTLAAFDEAAIFTIHGFCNRTLISQAFESGVAFDCELVASYSDLIRETVADFYRQELSAPQPPAASLDVLLNHAKTILDNIIPLSFEPSGTNPSAFLVSVINAVKNTRLPQRASAFKDCLIQLKDAVSADALKLDSKLLHAPALKSSAAKTNAPDLIEAIEKLNDLPCIAICERLREFLAHAQHGFESRKQQQQTMGYNDLLKKMAEALTDPECRLACELRKNYKVALVDEFQDTDPVQYKIFETVFKHRDSMLFMIGDPKQAIYGFRGGDIYAYLDAKLKVEKEALFTLSRNYRSAKELIAAVNHLFSPPEIFAEKNLKYHNSEIGREPARRLLRNNAPVQAPFQVVWVTGDTDGKAATKSSLRPKIIRHCAAQIAELLNGAAYTFAKGNQADCAPVLPSDIAVLVTSNKEAEAVQKRLRQLNIPAVIYKSGNVFAGEDALNLWHILSAMHSPDNTRSIKAALLTPWCGYGSQEIIALENNPSDLERHTAAFAALKTRWSKMGVMSALNGFMDSSGGMLRIASDQSCERRLTNFRHLAELLHQAESAAELSPEALLQWFSKRISTPDAGDETHEQRMESDRQAITIMTIHKSKGLQFPVVFIPFMLTYDINPRDDGGWTVHRDAAKGGKELVLPLGKCAHASLAKQRMAESLAEHLRLLYVAVTRAENHCSILMGNVKAKGALSAVNFLGQKHADAALTPDDFIAANHVAGATPPFRDAAVLTTAALSLAELDAQSPVPYAAAAAAAALATPPHPPIPPDNWAVMSYSALTEHAHSAPVHIKPDAGTDEISEAAPVTLARDCLPGGKSTGLCVHAIFEKLDFPRITPGWSPDTQDLALIDGQAARYGLYTANSHGSAERRQRLIEMLVTTLNRVLPDKETGFTLSSIPEADTRREWEFFSHVPEKIPLRELTDIGLTFKDHGYSRYGFMTGSVDLLFRRGIRYYFADWKTDTLGDYAPETLQQVMIERNYLFQAIVYAVALHSLLKQTLGGTYDFQQHFGGGYYCFVRGMGSNTGVFTYNPGRTDIEHWSALLRQPSSRTSRY
ncbi:MAG: UvrD-helicase domain-containing protein [Kiritimatiellae bacterium]|nr:UvrD-helicase domain-containing protein [Kiritimatiellia bacterium]